MFNLKSESIRRRYCIMIGNRQNHVLCFLSPLFSPLNNKPSEVLHIIRFFRNKSLLIRDQRANLKEISLAPTGKHRKIYINIAEQEHPAPEQKECAFTTAQMAILLNIQSSNRRCNLQYFISSMPYSIYSCRGTSDDQPSAPMSCSHLWIILA